ncbi:GNAT family N-acetyltransferase [Oceanobacillus neutriphilus]|uniref:N-acetyltransferase domain-containing protein n=1 Tax=Oceanobacillus neutriphilus TaxID=531815 RepID=A0ABQ2NSF6_9BACI|nr:GNAT family protein [Oceanobacillus neutriphilus]GGP09000.1 hypothetical protein GCM10011346_11300 [Oceanobacillus neutriphilus]
MGDLSFTKFFKEKDELLALMTSNDWEFHSNPSPTSEQIIKGYHAGWYHEGRETFWIEEADEKIGLIIIHDISDTIPSFDIRLDSEARGKGYGIKAVNWVIDYIFGLSEKKIRLEAYTRSDNLAMRKTLNKCGFVKEGYLRHAWENDDGSISDSVCYAMIRKDWKTKSSTPIKLDEFPF